MKTKRIVFTAAVLAVATAVAGTDANAADAFNPAREVVRPSSDLAFVNINPAIRMAAAFGDRSKGGHGSFGRFPAKFMTPFHRHSGAYHGVVIKG